MTSEVQPKTKIKASDINQLVNAVNNPQISVVGQGMRSSSIGGAMTISQDTPLKGDANAALPQLFSIKAGPSKKWMQKDASGKVYPSLYVYLGPSPAMALETVNINDNLIADGDHPHIFMYFNLSDPQSWKTHAYPIDQLTGEPAAQPFDPIPDTLPDMRGCMVDSTDNSLDGWYELPTSPLNAMPIWACCFLTFGEIPVLAFCTVDEIKTPITNSNSLSTVEMSSFEPDLSDLGTKLAALNSNLKMYGGLIGSPIKMYDLNPYSTDDLDHKFDQNGKVNAGYDWITLYSASNGLTFSNTSDKAATSFKPFCTGKKGSNGQWIYGFYLSMPYPKKSPGAYPGGSNPYGRVSGAVINQDIVEEGGSKVTVITLSQFETLGNNAPIRLVCYEGHEKEVVGQNVTMTITTPDEEPPLTSKGSLLGLTIIPDEDWDVENDGLVLMLEPVILSCTNSTVYMPKVYNSNATVFRLGAWNFVNSPPYVRACTVFPCGATGSLSFSNMGNVPHFTGDGVYMKYGLLTPPYESTSLLSLVKPVPPDCALHPTLEQIQNAMLLPSTYFDVAPGFGSNQFASIMYGVSEDNWSPDNGETWESDMHVYETNFIELYGFNSFYIDQKVNFYPEAAVEGIEVIGTGSTVRKDFDFVIRKRCELGGDESEGANIAYVRGFMPDSILDEANTKYRSIMFSDGVLEKDDVAHNALTLYGFPDFLAMPVYFNEDCKKLSQGYGVADDPQNLNVLARWWDGQEREINYLDLDFSWIINNITALNEAIGRVPDPSGSGGGISDIEPRLEELERITDEDTGRFWVRGRGSDVNYGSSIGNNGGTMVIDLTASTLKGAWIAESDFTVKGDIKAEDKIDFTQGPITIVDQTLGTFESHLSALDTYSTATQQFGSIDYGHITNTPQALDQYASQVASELQALHSLILAQEQAIQSLQSVVIQQQTDIQTMQGAIQQLQTDIATMQGQIANHEQRLQNGGL